MSAAVVELILPSNSFSLYLISGNTLTITSKVERGNIAYSGRKASSQSGKIAA